MPFQAASKPSAVFGLAFRWPLLTAGIMPRPTFTPRLSSRASKEDVSDRKKSCSGFCCDMNTALLPKSQICFIFVPLLVIVCFANIISVIT